MKKARAAVLSLLLAALCAPLADAAEDSVDCARAESAADSLVCADAQLATLDREVARLYRLARTDQRLDRDRRGTLERSQIRWIEGRDTASKAEDARRALADLYTIRIAELRSRYAATRTDDQAGISSGPTLWECGDLDLPAAVTFVTTDTQRAVVQFLMNTALLSLGRAPSGARYAAQYPDGEVVFWIKGREAMLIDPRVQSLTCRMAGSR